MTDGDETPPVTAQRRARRGDPPAHVAKVATAGMSGVFVFGLVAVMGWSQRPADVPVLVPPTQSTAVPTTGVAAPPTAAPTTSTLVPLATTVPPAPTTAASPPPAPAVVVTPAPPPPVVVVSEQSQ
jgi:hypothetical protein